MCIRDSIDVGARVDFAEEVPGSPLDPIGNATRAQEVLGLGEHLGSVEQNASRTLAALEDRCEERPDSPCDIADDAFTRPWVRMGQSCELYSGQLPHGVAEAGPLVGVLAKVVPDRVAERSPVTRRLRSLA